MADKLSTPVTRLRYRSLILRYVNHIRTVGIIRNEGNRSEFDSLVLLRNSSMFAISMFIAFTNMPAEERSSGKSQIEFRQSKLLSSSAERTK